MGDQPSLAAVLLWPLALPLPEWYLHNRIVGDIWNGSHAHGKREISPLDLELHLSYIIVHLGTVGRDSDGDWLHRLQTHLRGDAIHSGSDHPLLVHNVALRTAHSHRHHHFRCLRYAPLLQLTLLDSLCERVMLSKANYFLLELNSFL